MLCGKFKEEIRIQTKVNGALTKVSQRVVEQRNSKKMPFEEIKKAARVHLC